MVYSVRRTVTVTIVETLLLIWIDPNQQQDTWVEQTTAALSNEPPVVACSVTHMTVSVYSVTIPVQTEEGTV